MMKEPSFSIGIEEEYLLVNVETLELAAAPQQLMDECAEELEEQVSPEFLQCQIEIGTRVCNNVREAREDLVRLRSTIRTIAAKHGLAPIAVSCHPFAEWQRQQFTDKKRYRELERDLAGVARRLLICGMHVHVGIDDDELRVDLMGQFAYFLPHLLALSTSSPFWDSVDTGLNSYRLTVFDNLPRSGLPPNFSSFSEYQRSVQVLIDTGMIEDATKIWWDIRPSARFPTLESRICDVTPRLDDAISIAAITQCVMRMLFRLRSRNQRWRTYDNFLVEENRWRAQRYGIAKGLIDFGRGVVVPYRDLLEEILELVTRDAEALDCAHEVKHARNILKSGTSADRQRYALAQAEATGATREEAFRQVVRSLIDEFAQGWA